MITTLFDHEIIKFFLKAVTYLGGCFALYVFFQRVHNQAQQRALKAITDEIIKVNDFMIEFVIKYEQFTGFDVAEKDITELKILKSKVNAHLNYITEYLNYFPYNGWIKFFYYRTKDNDYSNFEKIAVEELELKYQDIITKDSILSIEVEFIEGNKLKKFDADHEVRILNVQDIDMLITLGSNLLKRLEENTRKFI